MLRPNCENKLLEHQPKHLRAPGPESLEPKLFASSGESVGYRRASASRLSEEPLKLPAGGLEGSLLLL